MICKVCNKPLDITTVDLGDVKVHLNCFFDDTIPNAPSHMDSNFEELNREREEAINKQIERIKAL